MSIPRPVHRHPWFRAPAAVAGALVLLGAVAPGAAPPAAATGTSTTTPPAAARAAVIDPGARLVGLTALVAQRQRAANAAMSSRNQALGELARARVAENAALNRADLLSRAADAAEARYQQARTRAGEVAAAVYRNTGQAHSLSRLLDSHNPTEYGYHQQIAHAAGEAQMKIVQRAVLTKRVARRLAEEADREKLHYHEQVVSLQGAIPARTHDVERTQDTLSRGRFWLSRWQS